MQSDGYGSSHNSIHSDAFEVCDSPSESSVLCKVLCTDLITH